MFGNLVRTVTLAVLFAPTGALAEDIMVHVRHNEIDPAAVSISAGDSVTFHNLDAMPGGHTVAADDGSVSSPPLEKDQAWTHEFDQPGEYGFHIKEHPDAKATVTVE